MIRQLGWVDMSRQRVTDKGCRQQSPVVKRSLGERILSRLLQGRRRQNPAVQEKMTKVKRSLGKRILSRLQIGSKRQNPAVQEKLDQTDLTRLQTMRVKA